MRWSRSRLALLGSVSIAALELTAPAAADPRDKVGPGTYAVPEQQGDLLTICNIADADPSCFFGAFAVGAAHAEASVDSSADGAIIQRSGDSLPLTILNSGSASAEIGAVALASNLAGSAGARASILDGLSQIGDGSGANLSFDNDGLLTIGALASAIAAGGGAGATAIGHHLIEQHSTGPSAAAELDNQGTISLAASAVAEGHGGAGLNAKAFASLDHADSQLADGTSGSGAMASLSNEATGKLDLAASANAAAASGSAVASAALVHAVHVDSTGNGGPAAALVSNDGAISLSAIAKATGMQAASAAAAIRDGGIDENAAALGGGNATGTLTNSGSLIGVALASASGTTALARAIAGDGAILQNVVAHQSSQNPGLPGGDASADLGNAGSIALEAVARASAVAPYSVLHSGIATADLVEGIRQSVSADAGKTVGKIQNSGTIDLGASAEGLALSGAAYGKVHEVAALSQIASGGGAVDAELTNSGTISLHDLAKATGSLAEAVASNAEEIYQQSLATNGDANASITNSGTIDIHAGAIANAIGGTALGTNVLAVSLMNRGIAQSAEAWGADHSALASFTNGAGGSIEMDVAASAHAATGVARAIAYFNTGFGISQNAIGTQGAGAEAELANSGTISFGVSARAEGAISALATAFPVFGGRGAIGQFAIAGGGAPAAADLVNNGIVESHATATAIAKFAKGQADADQLLNQYVQAGPTVLGTGSTAVYSSGGDAAAHLVNSGLLSAHAIAHATGVPIATASGLPGIAQALAISQGSARQLVVAGTGHASGSIVNSGTVQSTGVAVASIQASASAAAHSHAQRPGQRLVDNQAECTVFGCQVFSGAYATAGVGGALGQAVVGKSASAIMTNSGLLSASGLAIANGPEAKARANGGTMMVEDSTAFDGDAEALLVNDGEVRLEQSAEANGSEKANAIAGVLPVLVQDAHAGGGGVASATLENRGSLSLTASAEAAAATFASADAEIDGGLLQIVNAFDDGTAVASLTNSGAMKMTATAHAAGSSAAAIAIGYQVLVQSASAVPVQTALTSNAAILSGGNATGTLTNQGLLDLSLLATAAGSHAATATANLSELALQVVNASQTGIANFANSGSIDARGIANAIAPGNANASAHIKVGLQQLMGASQGISEVSQTNRNRMELANSGTLSFEGLAKASNTGSGQAIAIAHATSAVIQRLGGIAIGDNQATLSNSGTIRVVAEADALAKAVATSAFALASAHIGAGSAGSEVGAVIQDLGHGRTGKALIDNSGTLSIAALGNAQGYAATAIANVTAGFAQHVAASAGTGSAILDNHGTVMVAGSAAARAADGVANARGGATGIVQDVSAIGGPASASLTNSGKLAIADVAKASGNGAALAAASALGAYQDAHGGDSDALGTTNFVNPGTVEVAALAQAVGGPAMIGSSASPFMPFASANAIAAGLSQLGNRSLANNSGVLSIAASANAIGPTSANAHASAVGVEQSSVDASAKDATFANSAKGLLEVSANAKADGATGTVGSVAAGYVASGSKLHLDARNDGIIGVSAIANGPAAAHASAEGFRLVAAGSASATGPSGGPPSLSGSITNSGKLEVLSHASGGRISGGSAGGAQMVAGSSATASGISAKTQGGNLVVSNSGLIDVSAVVDHGGVAKAYGVRATTGDGPIAPGSILTFNNSGDIIVKVSADGGLNTKRGMAIDISEFHAPAIINLVAGSSPAMIYGNIALGGNADTINVENGETRLNGLIGPGCMPAGGPAALMLDDPSRNACGVGALNIRNGGNLHLQNSAVEGPSDAFVDSLTIGGAGTLTIDLPAPGAANPPPGSYSQIIADTANLDGTLVANVAPNANGLWDSTIYQNVIDARVRNGQFATCTIGGLRGSLLLDGACVYDNKANVDIVISRKSFDQVAGLNGNGIAVGTGLDSYYRTSLSSGASMMFKDLFLINDRDKYNRALDELSGSVYANYLNSFPSLGLHDDELLDEATSCGNSLSGAAATDCRTDTPVRLWGQLDDQARTADADPEAAKSRSIRSAKIAGADIRISDSGLLGIEAGGISNHLTDSAAADQVKSHGWQAGLYAVYDPGRFYLKGFTTFSDLHGKASRRIAFAALAPDATFSAAPTSKPNVHMRTFGVHAGARFPLFEGSILTPYFDVDRIHAKLDGLTELAGNGAGLTVATGSVNRTFLTGGLKFAGTIGKISPELDLGYRYRSGRGYSTFHGWFTPDPDNDFDIRSTAQRGGSLVAGVGIGGRIGPVLLSVSYRGEFNRDLTSHAANFKITLPLGGGKHASSAADGAAR